MLKIAGHDHGRGHQESVSADEALSGGSSARQQAPVVRNRDRDGFRCRRPADSIDAGGVPDSGDALGGGPTFAWQAGRVMFPRVRRTLRSPAEPADFMGDARIAGRLQARLR
jgi:hypothetical protein